DLVVHAGVATAGGHGGRRRPVQIQQPRLGGGGRAGLDDQGGAVAGAVEADHEALIALLDDQLVGPGGCSDPVAPDLVLAPGLVHSPDHSLLAYAVDTTGDERFTICVKDLVTGEIIDQAVTGGVHCVGQQAVVGG